MSDTEQQMLYLLVDAAHNIFMRYNGDNYQVARLGVL